MTIIQDTKEIAELVKKLGNIDLYKRIVGLEGQIVDLSREKLELERKVDELQRTLALKEVMKFKKPFYFQNGDSTPFCPNCFESHGKAVHVVDQSDGDWQCPACKTFYSEGEHARTSALYDPSDGNDAY